MILRTLIFTHQGHTYRFEREQMTSTAPLHCQVCYWHGTVFPPAEADTSGYQAQVEQKYAPYRQIISPHTFATEREALRWVAENLQREEAAENEQ